MEYPKHIILFDGECNFCSFWVKYVVKSDGKDVFRFTSLQSEKGRKLRYKYQVDFSIDSIVLIEIDAVYIKSTAALRILKTLGGFPAIFYGLVIVPKFIRDFFYDIIAGLRYRIFGKETCQLPTNTDYQDRFL